MYLDLALGGLEIPFSSSFSKFFKRWRSISRAPGGRFLLFYWIRAFTVGNFFQKYSPSSTAIPQIASATASS